MNPSTPVPASRRRSILWILLLLSASTAAGALVRANRPSRQPLATPASGVIPAEFETQQALLLTWDANGRQGLLESGTAMAAEASRRLDVVLVVEPAEDLDAAGKRLAAAGADLQRITFLPIGIGRTWVRDTGPLSFKDHQRGMVFLDFQLHDQDLESNFAARICRHFDRPRQRCEVILERGNLLSNGAGLLLTTDRTLEWNADIPLGREDISRILREEAGGSMVMVLPTVNDEPCGHVDMFATFTAPDVLLLASVDPNYDPLNAKILDSIARQLAGTPTPLGPLRIERIPLPRRRPNPYSKLKGGPFAGDMWLTYTNVAYVNGAVFMPSYSNPTPPEEAIAEAIFRRLLPDWEVVKISSDELISFGGSIHCATMNIAK